MGGGRHQVRNATRRAEYPAPRADCIARRSRLRIRTRKTSSAESGRAAAAPSRRFSAKGPRARTASDDLSGSASRALQDDHRASRSVLQPDRKDPQKQGFSCQSPSNKAPTGRSLARLLDQRPRKWTNDWFTRSPQNGRKTDTTYRFRRGKAELRRPGPGCH